MNKILENLKDPSWWFTAVLVAVIASLCAAYARDYINQTLSALSERYKRRKERQAEEEERVAHGAASDPALLSILFTLIVTAKVEFLFSCTVFLLIPIWRDVVFSSITIGGFDIKPILSIVLTLISGFYAINSGYKSLSRLRTGNKALDFYNENKKINAANDNQQRT